MSYEYPDIQRLRSAGYKLIERSPWHFQIEGHVLLNIWPSKCKYMVAYDSGASIYTNVVATVESILGPANDMKPKERPQMAPATPEEIAWQAWRFAFAREINTV